MDYPDYLQPVLNRINPDYGVYVSCDEGWWHLVAMCDKELSVIDSDYTIFQIKEKFGGLRYYSSPSNPELFKTMNAIVAKYEKMCSATCEVTGQHGRLMSDGLGMLRTLNDAFLGNGWSLRNDADNISLNKDEDKGEN